MVVVGSVVVVVGSSVVVVGSAVVVVGSCVVGCSVVVVGTVVVVGSAVVVVAKVVVVAVVSVPVYSGDVSAVGFGVVLVALSPPHHQSVQRLDKINMNTYPIAVSKSFI